MTVPSSVAKSGPYICNGVTDVFNYDFRIVDKSHLNVILTDANGAETSLTLTTHYTVSDVGSDTGSINLTAAGVALAITGTTLTILRNPPFTQETDLQNQGAYLAQTVEDRFDLLTMQIQTVKERSDRSIAIAASDEDTTLDDLTADLVKVAGIAADVSTVADNNANVTTAADNIDAIIAAPTEAANAASSASDASASASAAATSETNAATSASEAAASAASVNPNNLVHIAATDASTFGFVAGKDATPADTSKVLPTVERAEAYADTKAPLKTNLTGAVDADSNPGEFQGYALNEWKITDDATVGATADPSRQAYGIHINHVYGGDTLRGSRIALSVFSELTAASKNETGGGQNYVAGQFITLADDKDNGTDTGSGAKGAFFALNPVAILRGTAENVLHLSCGEFNIGTDDTTTLRYKCFANFANYPTDAAKGAEVDAALWFYKQGDGSQVGFDYGLLFSNEVLGSSGVQLLDTGGTILAAKDDGTCAIGFDFSDWTFTTAVLKSKGFQIGATGKIAASTDVHIVEPNGATATITTGSAPDAQGDVLGAVRFGFQDQTTFVDRFGADIRALANSAWTAGSSQPSLLQFRVAASGSATLSEQMRLSPGDAGTGKTAMFLNVEGTLVQVTVGAADSGGTGKRQLVVANAA